MADSTLIEIGAGGQVSLNPAIRLWPDGPPSRLPGVGSEITFPSPALRARGRVLLICEALAEHGCYFDAGVPA
jgi:hypothetical protein